MKEFICALNNKNSFSMVGYKVGTHHDHYYKNINREYIENKSTWAIRRKKGMGIGRGGSIIPDRYVYAILDW